jgi:hypothetical protein
VDSVALLTSGVKSTSRVRVLWGPALWGPFHLDDKSKSRTSEAKTDLLGKRIRHG